VFIILGRWFCGLVCETGFWPDCLAEGCKKANYEEVERVNGVILGGYIVADGRPNRYQDEKYERYQEGNLRVNRVYDRGRKVDANEAFRQCDIKGKEDDSSDQ